MHVDVVVPETTPERMRGLIEGEGATVTVHGRDWQAAHELASRLVEEKNATYVHPFDHPDLWAGHASMIEEIAEDLVEAPECIVVSVGGGGLLAGTLEGLERVDWHGVRVLAVETEGAACLAKSLAAGRVVELDEVTTIAKSLGARRVGDRIFDRAQKYSVESLVISDADALEATVRFADDHRLLVEPACGAALAATCLGDERLGERAVVIACGGANVSTEDVSSWRAARLASLL